MKETKNSDATPQKLFLFCKRHLQERNKIIKTLLEIQTSILDIVSNSSIEKEEEGIAPTRNEIIKEIQRQKKNLGKRMKKSL